MQYLHSNLNSMWALNCSIASNAMNKPICSVPLRLLY
jgi:hypothetical protein